MSKRKPQFDFWTIVTIGILAVFALFLIYPLISLFVDGFLEERTGAFTMANFTKFFGKKFYYRSLLNSLKLTVCVTICSLLIGVPLAYIMSFFKIRGKSIIEILIIISMMSPNFIGAYSWPQRRGHPVPFQYLRHQNAIHLRLWRHAAGLYAQAVPLHLHVCERRAQKGGCGRVRGGRKPGLQRHPQGIHRGDAPGHAHGHRLSAAGVHELHGGLRHPGPHRRGIRRAAHQNLYRVCRRIRRLGLLRLGHGGDGPHGGIALSIHRGIPGARCSFCRSGT